MMKFIRFCSCSLIAFILTGVSARADTGPVWLGSEAGGAPSAVVANLQAKGIRVLGSKFAIVGPVHYFCVAVFDRQVAAAGEFGFKTVTGKNGVNICHPDPVKIH